jgi:hypothetical protein
MRADVAMRGVEDPVELRSESVLDIAASERGRHAATLSTEGVRRESSSFHHQWCC